MAKGLKLVWKSKDFLRNWRARAVAWARPELPLRIIGQYVAEISKQAFDKQQDPETGAAWHKLNRTYAAYKRKKGKSSKALIWHGKLKRSIGYSIQLATSPAPSKVTIGSADKKGPWHQFGVKGRMTTSSRSGGSGTTDKLQARPFLGLNAQHEREIKEIVTKYLRGVK